MRKFKIPFLISSMAIVIVLTSIYFANYSKAEFDKLEKEHFHDSNIDSRFKNDFLLVNNRKNNLIICVENYVKEDQSINNEIIRNNVANLIEKDLKNKHHRWEKQGLDKFNISVIQGCSFDPLLLQSDKKHVFFAGDLNSMRVVDNASEERFGLFIVSEEVVNKHFSGTESRLAPEQFVCENGECLEVTSGIYLSKAELNTKEFIQQLKYVLGLDIIYEKIKSQ
jgi:hypothetical protein